MNLKKTRITLITLAIVSSNLLTSHAQSLSDIDNHWATKYLHNFVDNGYIKGYPDGTFKPNNDMTRAEFVVTFNRVFNLTAKNGKVFNDTKSHWAKDDIDIAVSNGVCKGVSSNEFDPDSNITREQVAVMISNYKKINNSNLDKLNQFSDSSNVSSWALNGLEGVLEHGYMNGYPEGDLKPTSPITRAEVVTTLNRTLDSKSEQKTNMSYSSYKNQLSGLGFKYDPSGDKYKFYNNNGISVGGVRLGDNQACFMLIENSPEFDSAIRRSFNMLLSTQGDKLYNMVVNGCPNQTIKMDGRSVTIYQDNAGVSVHIVG